MIMKRTDINGSRVKYIWHGSFPVFHLFKYFLDNKSIYYRDRCTRVYIARMVKKSLIL